ncbi:acyl-CoA synthetase [Dietzia sp.]|uniref:acyl-CoA synthetase n=1 Tax=Dietzia sp. TaxID=1871616 RepID=UPI002FDB1A97
MAFHIADLFEHSVDLVPERAALVQGERTRTYAQLEHRANQLAHALRDMGVGPGDRVAVYSRNTIEAIESMLAIFKLRAVMVNINYRYVAAELLHILHDSQARTVICERRYADVLTEALPQAPDVRSVLVVEDRSDAAPPTGGAAAVVEYEDALAAFGGGRDFGPRSDDDVYMLYTGGTTGNPKGVMWRHEDVFMVLGGGIDFLTRETVADEWELANKGAAADPIVSHALPPLIHGGAQWAILQALFGGRKSVIEPEFDAATVWRNITRHGINLMFVTGDAMVRPLLDAWDPEEHDASTLFYIGSSAALLSPTVKEQFLELFPNVLLSDNIGSSETGFSGMEKVEKGTGKSGGPRVFIDAETSVIDADGKPVEPGSGKVGKLARSGHIPLGYWRDEAKTAKTFPTLGGKRYAIPGDDARVEADGTVTMLGRGSTSINTGGEKVHPEEVEGALKAHPEVIDALVVGVPDERMGTKVAAVVSTRGGPVALAELNETARKYVARYKCPRALWIVDEIRRSPAGKPDYRWAAEITQSRPADDSMEFSR